MGRLHRSQRTVSIGNPDALKHMLNPCKCSTTATMYGRLQMNQNVSGLTCLYLPSASECERRY